MIHRWAKRITKTINFTSLDLIIYRTKPITNAVKSYEFKGPVRNPFWVLEKVLDLFLRERNALERNHTIQCSKKMFYLQL